MAVSLTVYKIFSITK